MFGGDRITGIDGVELRAAIALLGRHTSASDVDDDFAAARAWARIGPRWTFRPEGFAGGGG